MKVEGKKYARATEQYYLFTFNKYILNTIGNRKIFGLKYRELQIYFNELTCGLTNAVNIKKVFNVTYKYAMKNGYIKENPMKLVTLNIKEESKIEKDKIISKQEFDEILDKIVIVDKRVPNMQYTKFNYQAYSIALSIGWYTGLRVSEVFGLKKSDFDFDNGLINIQRRLEYHKLKKDELYTVEKMKTDASKAIIPMAYPLKGILMKWFDENPYEWVIVDIHGCHIHPASLNARVRIICDKLGLYHFHFHCLRHTFVTSLIENDINPSVAKELVRHGNIKTTLDIYTHVRTENKQEALDKVFGRKEEK